jgi:hypothetical protein
MKKTILMTAAAVAVGGILAGCATKQSCCSKKGCDMPNKAYYQGGTFDENGINKGGKFDAAAANKAYFDMCKKFGYPVYPALSGEISVGNGHGFWAVDFAKGDFTRYGMGGVIWVNEIREEYFGHDIYLLPNQAIAEHRHLATRAKAKDEWTGKEFDKDMPCKMESWLIRYGWVWSFSTEGEPNLDKYPELMAKLSPLFKEIDPKTGKMILQCVHVEKWTADGIAHKLPKEESWHFLMGGDEGAIVSEFANYHDGNGLRFSVPGVGF